MPFAFPRAVGGSDAILSRETVEEVRLGKRDDELQVCSPSETCEGTGDASGTQRLGSVIPNATVSTLSGSSNRLSLKGECRSFSLDFT